MLSKTALATELTPRLPPAPIDQDQSESEAELPRPRLSMNIDELDEDDSFQAPPTRCSVLLDEGMHTERSVERPRRAYSEMPLARGSLGSIRMSGRFDDLTELVEAEPGGIGVDDGGLSEGPMDVGDER